MITTNKPEQKSPYYDGIFLKSQEYRKHWSNSRYINLWKQILAWLPVDKNVRILDAGCGTGQLVSMLWDHGYKNIKGIDFSHQAIKMANEQRTDIALNKVYSVGDIFTQDVKDFDLIICTEVLEHVDKDQGLVKFWADKGKDLILSVPSFTDPAHVRYFQSEQDVKDRYGKYFITCECVKIGAWFVLKGENRNLLNNQK